MKKPHEMRPKGSPVDRSGLHEAIGTVTERVAAVEPANAAVRHVCGFLQESIDIEILGHLRLDEDPLKARMHEMFLRGMSHGIEIAADHLTDSTQIREVREWVESLDEEP